MHTGARAGVVVRPPPVRQGLAPSELFQKILILGLSLEPQYSSTLIGFRSCFFAFESLLQNSSIRALFLWPRASAPRRLNRRRWEVRNSGVSQRDLTPNLTPSRTIRYHRDTRSRRNRRRESGYLLQYLVDVRCPIPS